MKGRLENTIKTEKHIAELLEQLPPSVEKFYMSRPNKESVGSLEYIRKIRNFLAYIDSDTKNIDITQVTEDDISKYLKTIQKTIGRSGEEKETSFAYRKQVYTILNSFFSYLYKKREIEENPMIFIDRPSSVDKIKRVRLSENDLALIVEAAKEGEGNKRAKNRQGEWAERDVAIILTLATTGMRETALSEINIDDIDFDQHTLRIIDKRHKIHIYHLTTMLEKAILEWLYKREILLDKKNIETDSLFISNRGTRLCSASISYLTKKYSEEALGFSISPHKLRAAFCTILYNKTGDIEFVRDAVGHSNVATTQRYIVKDDTAKVKASEIMGQLFS